MLILGLTGPSGAGKSLVAGVLAGEGFAVLDADKAARAVVEPGSPCLLELQRIFGGEILAPDGTLDRKALAAAAFKDEEGVRRLNAVTHPHIMRRLENELDARRGEGWKCAVLDAPALFEAGAERLCGRVAVVVAPQELRLVRIMIRDGLTRDEALRRIRAQQPDAFYTARADYVLNNDGGEEDLRARARLLALELLSLPGTEGGGP